MGPKGTGQEGRNAELSEAAGATMVPQRKQAIKACACVAEHLSGEQSLSLLLCRLLSRWLMGMLCCRFCSSLRGFQRCSLSPRRPARAIVGRKCGSLWGGFCGRGSRRGFCCGFGRPLWLLGLGSELLRILPQRMQHHAEHLLFRRRLTGKDFKLPRAL